MVVVKCDPDLLELVRALNSASRLASLLYSRQKQSDEDGDNRDDRQQLDQRKPASSRTATVMGSKLFFRGKMHSSVLRLVQRKLTKFGNGDLNQTIP